METEIAPCAPEELLASCRRFVDWLDREGLASFDPYDLWGTRYGLWARRVYYNRKRLGAAFVAPFLLIDVAMPTLRRFFVARDRFATADAQVLLAYLNLYAITGESQFLERAISVGEEILNYAIPGYSGLCWGYPFDWQNGKGAPWKKNVPYITCTPYCYEAFAALHQVTGKEIYQRHVASIAEFVYRDLKETATSSTAAAGSYSPNDSSKVVNASAYRAFVLLDAAKRFDRADFAASGRRNLAFVLESQRADGSWLYAMDGTKSFIDHFHTCFNLKNLAKANQLLNDTAVTQAIARGFEYYRRELFYPTGDPKSFAAEPRLQIAKLEMYNFAEGITLGTLLADQLSDALPLAQRLAARLSGDFQLPSGHFVTRVFKGGIRHEFPFLRWPQAQLFYSLTNLARKLAN